MYGTTTQSRQSHRRGYSVGNCIPYHAHVLVCDYTHRSEPRRSIHSFIDNREFTDGGRPLGPVGYQGSIRPTLPGLIPNVMFLLNYWFADGLLVGPVSNVAFARPQV